MTGIAIKLNKHTEAGPDIETVYFATMRKAPQLRELLRGMMKAESALAATGRFHSLAVNAMSGAATIEDISTTQQSLEEALLALDDAAQLLIDARQAFLVAGFTAAGYDIQSADRLACEIPSDRMSDIIVATRIGSGMMDFSYASKPSA